MLAQFSVNVNYWLTACSSYPPFASVIESEAIGEQVSLGKRIIERRQILKVTQQELASALGITPQHISAIEKNQNSPSLSLLPKLSEELGVSVDYLLTGKETVITDTIPAIKSDKTLSLKVKRALIALVEEHRTYATGEES